jgi:hypothetical protein
MGHLSTGENRELLEEFLLFPLLQHKLTLLTHALTRTTLDRLVSQATMAFFQFHMDRNFGQIFGRQQKHLLHKAIQVLPSDATRQRDGVTLQQRVTFLNASEVLLLHILPSKMKC